ncbi:MAG: type III pantothenate kinase [bacterium]
MKETVVFSIGNTNVRYGIFSGSKLEKSGIYTESLKDKIKKTSYEKAFMISVNKRKEKIFLENYRDESVIKLQKANKVINSEYDVKMLGIDRFVAIVKCLKEKTYPALLIDTGTADTFDYIDGYGVHKGGFITPGLTTMARSLEKFTSVLKETEPEDGGLKIGKNTSEAMKYGIYTVWVTGILSFCAMFKNKEPKCRFIIMGGNSARLKDYITEAIVDSDYLLKAIYEYGAGV